IERYGPVPGLLPPAQPGRTDEELGPACARERPLLLLAQLVLVAERSPDVELHRRLALPSVVISFQEVVEEAPLQLHAVWEVEPLLVAAGVHFEPLLRRSGLREGLEVAARVQPEATPVRGAQERHLDRWPVGAALAIAAAVELWRALRARIGPISGQLLIAEL